MEKRKQIYVYYDGFGSIIINSENEILEQLIEYLNSIYTDFIDYNYFKNNSYIECWDIRKFIPKILEFCMKKRFTFKWSMYKEEVGE